MTGRRCQQPGGSLHTFGEVGERTNITRLRLADAQSERADPQRRQGRVGAAMVSVDTMITGIGRDA